MSGAADASDSATDAGSPPLPWYSFLYRLLGAQGTFWLWILAVITLWWTAEPALIRLSNRKPQRVAVEAVDETAGTLTRWVSLNGVEVTLDWRLLALEPRDLDAPVILLIDPDDTAAGWWRETRRLADQMVAAVSSGDVLAERAEARRGLQDRYVQLTSSRSRERMLPAPQHAVLVQDARTHSIHDVQPRSAGRDDDGPLLDGFERELDDFGALVRERVRIDVTHLGVLNDAPQTVLDTLAAQLDVHATPWLIQVGREPHDLETYVFGGAAIIFVFLAFGLFGASRVPTRVEPA